VAGISHDSFLVFEYYFLAGGKSEKNSCALDCFSIVRLWRNYDRHEKSNDRASYSV
jgi:hypothetical protein